MRTMRAAVKMKADGAIFTDRTHLGAAMEAEKAGRPEVWDGEAIDGFIIDGEWLTRRETRERFGESDSELLALKLN